MLFRSPLHLVQRARFGRIPDRASFNTVSDADVASFKKLLGNDRVLHKDEIQKYNEDWIAKHKGNSTIVLKPKTTEEVQEIINYCSSKHLAITPQSGNTGLVTGSIPMYDEIVVSMELMNQSIPYSYQVVIDFNHQSGNLICQSGCILDNLSEFVGKEDHIMPLDLGSSGSCMIGGNASTNAGGIRFMRYGTLRGSIVGLEAVTGKGDIINVMNRLPKDNTGFDLKQLFIGSEGTLGIITGVSIMCPPKPKAVGLCFMGMDSYDKVLDVMKVAKSELAEIISACEFLDASSLEIVMDQVPNARRPLSEKFPFYM